VRQSATIAAALRATCGSHSFLVSGFAQDAPRFWDGVVGVNQSEGHELAWEGLPGVLKPWARAYTSLSGEHARRYSCANQATRCAQNLSWYRQLKYSGGP